MYHNKWEVDNATTSRENEMKERNIFLRLKRSRAEVELKNTIGYCGWSVCVCVWHLLPQRWYTGVIDAVEGLLQAGWHHH